MSQPAARYGFRLIKVLGLFALIAAVVAVGRIVLRAFKDEGGEPEDAHHGI